ncbi:MAG: hypothetical protein OXH79_02115 [Boseongicola sp.]|nr:hypothetical protein [Boseongicola sp.]
MSNLTTIARGSGSSSFSVVPPPGRPSALDDGGDKKRTVQLQIVRNRLSHDSRESGWIDMEWAIPFQRERTLKAAGIREQETAPVRSAGAAGKRGAVAQGIHCMKLQDKANARS